MTNGKTPPIPTPLPICVSVETQTATKSTTDAFTQTSFDDMFLTQNQTALKINTESVVTDEDIIKYLIKRKYKEKEEQVLLEEN